MKNLIKPANDAEAMALKALLEEHNIQAQVVSFRDTAYDGIYQAKYGWGVIRVAETDLPAACRIIEDWQRSAPAAVDWEEKDTAS